MLIDFRSVKNVCMRNNQMVWQVGDDTAWHKVGPNCYRHYSGVSMIQKGKLWDALDRDGNATYGHRTSRDAVMAAFQTSTLRRFDGPDDRKRGYTILR
jgi:hypothetical protein